MSTAITPSETRIRTISLLHTEDITSTSISLWVMAADTFFTLKNFEKIFIIYDYILRLSDIVEVIILFWKQNKSA